MTIAFEIEDNNSPLVNKLLESMKNEESVERVAEYDLEQVKAAAQNLDIEYRGRKVSRDIANLGYDLHDVSACLCQLSKSDFRKTHNYDKQPPDDEYICRYRKDSREDKI